MNLLFFDTETYSEVDLKTAGTHRYAEDPTTEITVAQWAVDDGEPVVEDLFGRKPPSEELQYRLQDPDTYVVIHSSAFDRTLCRWVWGIEIPPERIIDTMVMALSHSLPGGLDKVGQIMGLSPDEEKDKRGRQLIQLFCKPRPKNMGLRRATPETHPAEWAEFLEYSRQDIVAMRASYKKLPKWNYDIGKPEHRLWCLDQAINDRGFGVDVELATAAVAATQRAQASLTQQVQEETGGEVEKATKRDQLLKFIVEAHGVALPDLKADTLRRRAEDPELPQAVRTLLNIRLEASMTSAGKYKALLNAASHDDRLRNTIQFCGAARTGRDAGRIFQPQNMMRPDEDFDEDQLAIGVGMLKAGCPEILFPNVMRLTANVVRGCIVAGKGKKLTVADLSNIEGRVLAWLAGEDWKVQAFADYDNSLVVDADGRPVLDKKGERQFTNPDIYKLAYAKSFSVDPKTVTKGQRQQGKVQELGLGYQGGVGAFLTFAAVYNMDLDAMATAVFEVTPEHQIADARKAYDWAVKGKRTFGLSREVYVACEILKTAWRRAHPATVTLWELCETAFRQATLNPGEVFHAGRIAVRRDGAWLRMRLPSGRYLCYMRPEVGDKGELTFFGVNQYTRQWGRIKTYAGKTVENITQAVARDILFHGVQLAEENGYPVVLRVHDELLTETPNTPEYSHERLAELMSVVPAWAKGLPLAAAGFETLRYRKN